MSIRIVKLTSGEELIADVTDGATTSLVVGMVSVQGEKGVWPD